MPEAPSSSAITDRIQHLMDERTQHADAIATIDQTLGDIAQKLEAKYDEVIGSGNVCLAYQRWYEIRGLPLPPGRTNMGRPRKAR
jgi:hypothetical protein